MSTEMITSRRYVPVVDEPLESVAHRKREMRRTLEAIETFLFQASRQTGLGLGGLSGLGSTSVETRVWEHLRVATSEIQQAKTDLEDA